MRLQKIEQWLKKNKNLLKKENFSVEGSQLDTPIHRKGIGKKEEKLNYRFVAPIKTDWTFYSSSQVQETSPIVIKSICTAQNKGKFILRTLI